jgi:hypothetical protein
VLAIVVALVIWVVGEGFGMILAGGATDPNSGLLLVLLALTYWPTSTMLATTGPQRPQGPQRSYLLTQKGSWPDDTGLDS